MPWRCGLPLDFSDLAAAAAPEAFPAPLDAPAVASLIGEGAVAPFTADGPGPGPSPGPGPGPGPPATESPCPTAAMALSLSLGRVLVEPME